MLRQLLPLLYPHRTWLLAQATPTVYLTFDDGPHPEITPWVLSQLDAVGASASFFVVGQQAQANRGTLDAIRQGGHLLGNHTWQHLKGWSSSTSDYLQDLHRAAQLIPSRWFRPPYGKMTKAQARRIRQEGYAIAMWDILTRDYKQNWTAADCWRQTYPYIRNGSILVLHDSEKAWPRLQILLPQLLDYLEKAGYRMEALPANPT